MIPASEARRRSRINFGEKNNVILDEIERNIRKNIEAGKLEMVSEGDLSPEIQAILRTLGYKYKVDVEGQYQQSYYTISWK